jgi:hypothetical protein
MRKHAGLGVGVAIFGILSVGSSCKADGGPTIISWSASASQTGHPTSSFNGTSSGGGTAQIGSGTSAIYSMVSASTNNPITESGVGDPNTYDFYLLNIETQIPSGLSANTASVSGDIVFGISEPTLVYLDGVYMGNKSAGYSFNGNLSWSPARPEQGVAPSSYTLLPSGVYEISVNDSNTPLAGTGTSGFNVADIAFLVPIPEPTAVWVALPLLMGSISRRWRCK